MGPHGAACWGSAAPRPHSGPRLPVQPWVRPSQALVMRCLVQPARVGRTLAGDPPGTQHHEPGAEPPAAFGASRMGGAAHTPPQETGLRSCLCSRLVSGGQPREGRFHERGAPLSAPRMGLPRCPCGIWAGVVSGDCLSFQWFLAMFCLEGRV